MRKPPNNIVKGRRKCPKESIITCNIPLSPLTSKEQGKFGKTYEHLESIPSLLATWKFILCYKVTCKYIAYTL